MKAKARSFGKSAVALAAIGIISKLIGALYRVPLTNIVGAEGMGLYQMVFPLYTVLLAFCGGGITSAVSRVVAKYTAIGNDEAAQRTLKVAILPLIAVSVVSTAAVALLRNVISGLQGNSEAGIAYLAICPSLLFAGGISVLRGYFQGKAFMLPSGVSQLVEQVVKLALGLYLSRLLLPYGVKYAVAGALAGVTASELFALIYLAVRFWIAARKRVRYVAVGSLVAETSAEFSAPRPVTDKMLLKELYSFALSVTLGSLVLPITQMIDSVLVINLLMHSGATRASATALFGLFVGPVGTLINMPTVVALSVAIAFLPTITSAVERGGDPSAVTRTAAKWIMLFVIPVTAAFMIFPDSVCSALYSRGLTAEQLQTVARLLRVQAIGVFYIGVLQLATTVLQGHNNAHRPVINLVVGACVKVGLTPLLVRAFGIIGAAGATAACYAVAATLTVRCASSRMPIGVSVADAFIKPIACTVAGAAAFIGVSALTAMTTLPALWQTLIAGGAFLTVYASGVILTGALDVKAALAHARARRVIKSGGGMPDVPPDN
ncbi:putative polysaccharide biosynthesis protein [Anaerocaecibacter muris]|uniref:putative polysaccharide biosynthesis protein n=1 Tax=Anaerocaecibacter muris TaxID=2941513 RepID=UPI003F6922D0